MEVRSFPSLLVVLCVAVVACSRSDQASSEAVLPSAVAFVDVNVIPMDRDRIIEAQTVVVFRTRIVAIGPVDETKVPEGARRIEGSGRYLMPGLADMHAHVDEDSDLLLFLANGVTTVRNMAGGPAHLERRERIARGELLGPTMYTAGPVIDGPVELWPGNAAPPLPPEAYEVIESRRDGERVVREQAAAGYDFIKVYDNLPAEAYEGVATEALELGIPVVGHVPFGVGLAGAMLTNFTSIEHLRGYIYELFADNAELSLGWDKRSRFLAWNHVDTTRFAHVIRATINGGIWNVPTLTRYQKNMMPTEEHLRRYTSAEARYVNPAIIERMLSGRSFTENVRYGSFVEADFVAGRRVFQTKKAFVKALHDAGANILLGSDDWFGGFATHEELQNLVDAGLTPYQAIATGTKNAAALLDKAEFGTVAVGMRADLVLLEDNPLTNLRHLRNRTGVMVRGRWFVESELKQMLDQLAASYTTASPGSL